MLAYFKAKYFTCRFDHSPCDPAINLKGSPSELLACVACGQHFPSKEAWRKHVETKVHTYFAFVNVFLLDFEFLTAMSWSLGILIYC